MDLTITRTVPRHEGRPDPPNPRAQGAGRDLEPLVRIWIGVIDMLDLAYDPQGFDVEVDTDADRATLWTPESSSTHCR